MKHIGSFWLLLLCVLSGCSLLTIKSPEVPLTPEEQEARLLTRDYAAHFANVMVRTIDDASKDAPPSVSAQALRLKLGSVSEITRASTGLSAVGSLLDTWAFTLQLRDFLVTGAGEDLFGAAQPDVRRDVIALAAEADDLGRKGLAADYASDHQFVADYVKRHPLGRVDFVRPSLLAEWVADPHAHNPLRSSGTVAQALGDVSDRLRIYGERIPNITLWQAEVALDRAGFDDAAYRNALHDLDAQLARISALAETSPRLAHEAIGELRADLHASSDRLDASWLETLRTLHTERAALAENIAGERASLVTAFDQQRIQLSADADRIVARTVETSWEQARALVREALLLLIVLAVLVLGLPFGAGYLVGRRVRAAATDRS
jgi:hypothetical protein